MLTERLQIQAIANLLAGLPVDDVRLEFFSQPWRNCWLALSKAPPENRATVLHETLSGTADAQELLLKILSTKPGYQPFIPSLADIAHELPPIEWIWEKWIPRGFLTLLGASQGTGKSFVGLDWLMRIIHNRGFPDGTPVPNPGANVIYVDGEGVPQILNERAAQYGLDRSKLYLLLAEPGEMLDLTQPRYQERLTEMIAILKPGMIVLDSLLSLQSRGQNGVEDVRPFIGYLTRLAAWANCGVVLIHHIRKPSGFGTRMMNADFSIEDLSGAGFITQQALVVLGMRVVQTGPEFDPNGPRELKMLKSNISGYPEPLGFVFKPLASGGVGIEWQPGAPQPFRERTERDECQAWLAALLQERYPEALSPRDVVQFGEEAGFSRAMVYRARKNLALQVENTEGRQSKTNRWRWSETGQADQPMEGE